MSYRHAVALVVVLAGFAPKGHSGLVDFTGLDIDAVASVNGQDFDYAIGTGPSLGTLNVRLLSDSIEIVDAMSGGSPDATGFQVIHQNRDQDSVRVIFTFDQEVAFRIVENTSSTIAQSHSFSASGGFEVLSSSGVNIANNDPFNIHISQFDPNVPFGDYTIMGSGNILGFSASQAIGFAPMATAISIDVVPEPGMAGALLLACSCTTILRRQRPRNR